MMAVLKELYFSHTALLRFAGPPRNEELFIFAWIRGTNDVSWAYMMRPGRVPVQETHDRSELPLGN